MTTDANNHPRNTHPRDIRTVRAMLVDPVARVVRELELDPRDIRAITVALNCEVFDIVHLTPDGTEVMAVDDEGRLSYPNPNGYFRFVHPVRRAPMSDWICGRGLVMGARPDTGDTTDSQLMLTTLASAVEFADEPPPYGEVEPTITVSPLH